ncbi:MAG TPA: serine/threonine-protein kinase [Thermoanaerobaculia bacterium]|nr:serine/threonine-protein kinase [Thermoanaerobaculia bacterium]
MDWESLFDELLELPPARRAERLAHLERQEPTLAQRLRALLAADEDASADFLDRPLGDIPAEALPAIPDSAPRPELAAGTLVGAWRILEPIGLGGMGEVYLAERADGHFEQRVALKLIKRGMDSREIVRRFLIERQILARLDHPGIARLLDGGSAEDGRPYFVMEHVEGEPLFAHCSRTGASLERRVRLVKEVAEAVDAAHQRLVVHRDLKPSNLLLTRDGRVKLLDFGIAKLLDEADGGGLTRLEDRPLTPNYAAPEQILGEPVTTATDVYALGVLLFQLLTGRLPHQRESRSLPALVAEVGTETATRASTAVRALSAEEAQEAGIADPGQAARRLQGELDTVLAKALQRDPARRYRSAATLAEELERFLGGRPILARPDSARYRLRKWVARNRLVAAAALLVTASLTGGLAAALWQASIARAEARRADAQAQRAEQVRDFMISIFKQADPAQAQGQTLTARDVLEQGARRIETELAASPDLQVELYNSIAEIEFALGAVETGYQHARRSLALAREHLPPGALDTGHALTMMGNGALDSGDVAGAVEHLSEAVPIVEAGHGPLDLCVANTKARLAMALQQQRETERALVLQQEAYEVYRRLKGDDDPDTAWNLQLVANRLRDLDRFDEAADAYRRALPVMEKAMGPRHPATAFAHVTYGTLLERIGRSREAESELRLGLEAQRVILPPGHLAMASALTQLGILLSGQERFEEAEAAFGEALLVYGGGRVEACNVERLVGLGRIAQERFDEGVAALERALAICRAAAGEDAVPTRRAAASLAWGRARRGDPGSGPAAMKEALARLAASAGQQSPDLLLPTRQLGELLRRSGELAEAERVLSTLREREIARYGRASHRDVVRTSLELAEALIATGRPEARARAGTLLDEALAARGAESYGERLEAQLVRARGRVAGEATSR